MGNQPASVELAARGVRPTRQRIAVLQLLRRARNHPTAHLVHTRLRRAHPNLSLKTVYEALDVLVNAGLAGCVTDAGVPYRYEANPEPHYHAQCRSCGLLADLPANADGLIRGHASPPDGFAVERVQVSLLGRCGRCRNDF